jgi:hypothetical protein
MSQMIRLTVYIGLAAVLVASGSHVAIASHSPILSMLEASAIRGGDCSMCNCKYANSGRCNADNTGCNNPPCAGSCAEACTNGGVWAEDFTEIEAPGVSEGSIDCGNSLDNPTCEGGNQGPCKCTGTDSGEEGEYCGFYTEPLSCN